MAGDAASCDDALANTEKRCVTLRGQDSTLISCFRSNLATLFSIRSTVMDTRKRSLTSLAVVWSVVFVAACSASASPEVSDPTPDESPDDEVVKASAQRNSLVCSLIDLQKKSNKVSSLVDMGKPLEEVYSSKGALNVGQLAFSFDLQVEEVARKSYEVNVVFYENKSVQDEIGSTAFAFKPSSVEAGKPVFVEPISFDTEDVANFVCYYNK